MTSAATKSGRYREGEVGAIQKFETEVNSLNHYCKQFY